MDIYHSDNSGHRIPPHPNLGDPILLSGQVVSASAQNTDAEIVVVAGATYAITCIKGAHYFGILTTATAANCIWACGSGQTIVITIPSGTALHYQTPDSSRKFILRRLKNSGE